LLHPSPIPPVIVCERWIGGVSDRLGGVTVALEEDVALGEGGEDGGFRYSGVGDSIGVVGVGGVVGVWVLAGFHAPYLVHVHVQKTVILLLLL